MSSNYNYYVAEFKKFVFVLVFCLFDHISFAYHKYIIGLCIASTNHTKIMILMEYFII
jgi:riboflavin transporter FmnP